MFSRKMTANGPVMVQTIYGAPANMFFGKCPSPIDRERNQEEIPVGYRKEKPEYLSDENGFLVEYDYAK